ncbi:MAG: NAD-dependent deacylase [Acidobacteria bacterium]|nr:NAD-dependent deacylase [Acidobacteriota bacterium]
MSVSERAFSFEPALIQDLIGAKRILFITGAGISAESGLPTYRGVGGLYEDVDTPDDLPIETILSGPMFQRRPDLTWRYMLQLEEACRGASYNRAHEAIARFQEHFEVVVLTQNVDGFHGDAGSQNVIEIHGNLRRIQCIRCSFCEQVPNYAHLQGPTPRCQVCGDVLRPAVVLFGEMLPPDAVDRMVTELERGFDLIFSVGTSALFPYIAEPVWLAAEHGIPTVEINPVATDLSSAVRYRISAQAGDALQRLWRAWQSQAS